MINLTGEIWRKIDLELDSDTIKAYHFEVSNYGRIKRIAPNGKENILKGSLHDGYSILKLKIICNRKPDKELYFNNKKSYIKNLKKLIADKETYVATNTLTPQEIYHLKQEIRELNHLHDEIKVEYAKEMHKDNLSRTKNLALLFHRLVAQAFLEKTDPKQEFVLHKDFNKQHNHVDNLMWCTQEDLSEHWKKNPKVVASYEKRKGRIMTHSKSTKLTIPKVMLIKKLLNEGVSLVKLSKRFNITSTQIKRIKTGENWGSVKAAE